MQSSVYGVATKREWCCNRVRMVLQSSVGGVVFERGWC